jgi:hypothetical protein
MPIQRIEPKVYFSEFYEVAEKKLEDYGAFNITVVTDLPLFIDPFLLFHSSKPEYKKLHEEIIKYLCFLRDNHTKVDHNRGLLQAWFYFKEVKQTWLGFSKGGNSGRGLSKEFANSLIFGFRELLKDFGKEDLTEGSHLEKLCLVGDGVGRDMISDFITNLVKHYLLQYTQKFSRSNLKKQYRSTFSIERAIFNYETQAWQTATYELPVKNGDFVLLCPKDLLTKDDTWINRSDLYKGFARLPSAITDAALRAQVNEYFKQVLPKKPSKKDKDEAIHKTLQKFPKLLDYFILNKENEGHLAERKSAELVSESENLYITQFRQLVAFLANKTDFYNTHPDTRSETLKRILFLKDAIENKGCHKIFYIKNEPIRRESDLQILFRLTWFDTVVDISREVNDGRGPVDFKASMGAKDKTLIEMKLVSNTSLEKNLKKQVEIYQKASDAPFAYKVILYFTELERAKLQRILKTLQLQKSEWIVTIDGRKDNKPSGSKAID